MSCSSKRNRLLGSCSSTLVSSTNSLAGPVPRALRGRAAGAGAAGLGCGAVCTSGTTGAMGATLAGSTVLASRGLRDASVRTLARVLRGVRAGLASGAGAVVAVALRAAPRRDGASASAGGVACARKASGCRRAARRVGAGGSGMVRGASIRGFRKQKAAWRPRRLCEGGRALRSTAASGHYAWRW